MSWLTDFWNSYGSLILQDLGPHLFMVGVSLLIGIVVAVPLGILLTRFPRQASPVIGVVSIFQTISSLVFFALLLPWLGIGLTPVAQLAALVVILIAGLIGDSVITNRQVAARPRVITGRS